MTVLRVRKKPVEVQAMLYDGTNDKAVSEWVNDQPRLFAAHRIKGGDVLLIPTLEGVMEAQIGDYIIRGLRGEFYPCKPDIFAKSYDVLSDNQEVRG